jgi:hypothetical protein
MIMWTPSSGKWNINDSLPQTNHFVPIFKRNLPLPPDLNVDIEMYDDQSSEDENILFNIPESEKYINGGSDIVEFNSNVDDNDDELSSSSSSCITDNEKNIKKNKREIVKNE